MWDVYHPCQASAELSARRSEGAAHLDAALLAAVSNWLVRVAQILRDPTFVWYMS